MSEKISGTHISENKKVHFNPKSLIFATKRQFLVLESRFLVKRAYHQYTPGATRKKIPSLR